MTTPDLSRELEILRSIAREASTVVMGIYATEFTVEMKGINDPVTRADKEANALICDRLALAFQGDGVFAEESVPKDEAERARISAKERIFFVDPVDGTREFADKNGEFCVMIGLAIDGRAAAGVVAVPVENKLFWGSLRGSFVEPLDGTGEAKRLEVSPAAESIRAVVSRSHPSPRTQAILAAAGVVETIPCGSVGLKAARVIEARAELYVHPSRGASLWDACGPDALIRGAGGVMTTIDGKDIDYRGELPIRNGLIATTSLLLPRVLAAIAANP